MKVRYHLTLSFESRECRSRVVIKIGDKNSGGGIRVEVKESGRSRVES